MMILFIENFDQPEKSDANHRQSGSVHHFRHFRITQRGQFSQYREDCLMQKIMSR